jgi:hypothetical protein
VTVRLICTVPKSQINRFPDAKQVIAIEDMIGSAVYFRFVCWERCETCKNNSFEYTWIGMIRAKEEKTFKPVEKL